MLAFDRQSAASHNSIAEIAGFNPGCVQFREICYILATRGNGNNETHEPGTRGYEKATVCAKDASKVREAHHKAAKPW